MTITVNSSNTSSTPAMAHTSIQLVPQPTSALIASPTAAPVVLKHQLCHLLMLQLFHQLKHQLYHLLMLQLLLLPLLLLLLPPLLQSPQNVLVMTIVFASWVRIVALVLATAVQAPPVVSVESVARACATKIHENVQYSRRRLLSSSHQREHCHGW
jgi:hypothetical protein